MLSQVLRYAIKAKRPSTNPAEEIDLPEMTAAERRYLTHLAVMRLAMAAGRFRLLVFALAYIGIRFGEAIALRTWTVDPDAHGADPRHPGEGAPAIARGSQRRCLGLPQS
ncbi:hypothetical protein ACFXHA_40220 [Nocardia sp. NPDC059240]|uniref:hypothetical protein n=1 Tax=Nocardia sp. NPDC059240 TaxID=3346786 RepID=UPI0036A7D1E1